MTFLVLVESNTTGTGRLFCARARELGLRPVVFARDPGRYPYVEADAIENRRVDTTSTAAVLDACGSLPGPVAGVTSSSEYFIATASEAARALGLAHPDPDAVRICRDKHAQRRRLRDGGVPSPRFGAAGTPDEASELAGRIGFPVVVKPVAGSGSIAVRLCHTPGEVRAAAAAVLDVDPATLALPPQTCVVVEEYLTGPEFSVETFDDVVVCVTRKHLGPEPYFVETGHDIPAPLPASEHAALHAGAVAALRALGLGWGAAHVELRNTPAGPRVVEVNPRLAGGMIPRAVQEASGIDLIHHMVAKAAGRSEPLRLTRAIGASIRFVIARTAGRLVSVDGVDKARAMPGVVEVGVTGQPGQEVTLRHSFQDRLGYVIATDENSIVAAHLAQTALDVLSVKIEALP